MLGRDVCGVLRVTQLLEKGICGELRVTQSLGKITEELTKTQLLRGPNSIKYHSKNLGTTQAPQINTYVQQTISHDADLHICSGGELIQGKLCSNGSSIVIYLMREDVE